jgi:hypothetical protein
MVARKDHNGCQKKEPPSGSFLLQPKNGGAVDHAAAMATKAAGATLTGFGSSG